MIVFDKVCFSYNTRQVLKDLCFSINENERVAFSEERGEGKITISKLILGL